MPRQPIICNVEGCNTLTSLHDHRGGRPYFRAICARHWKLKRYGKNRMVRGACEACGWRGNLHRHRLVPGAQGGAYVDGNVKLLCPNCHAAEHGKGEPNAPLRMAS